MKILLDECVDQRLKPSITDHDVRTVREMGWTGKANGELLKSASEEGFQILVTIDKRMKHQQNISKLPLAIAVFDTLQSTLTNLEVLIPQFLERVDRMKPGEVYEIR